MFLLHKIHSKFAKMIDFLLSEPINSGKSIFDRPTFFSRSDYVNISKKNLRHFRQEFQSIQELILKKTLTRRKKIEIFEAVILVFFQN